MNDVKELETQIDTIEAEIDPIQKQLTLLEDKRRALENKLFKILIYGKSKTEDEKEIL